MPRVVAIILSRMTSRRLPGKALVDICGQPTLRRMVDRVRGAGSLDAICIATSTNVSDDPIARLAAAIGIEVVRGSEHDVLERTYLAARTLGAETVVRLTADCPMIDPALIDEVVRFRHDGGWDYAANCNIRSFPDGLDVEAFSRDALARAHREAAAPFLREHVTPYIRGSHPQHGAGDFAVGDVVCPWDFSHIRWTLDTAADLEVIRGLVARLPEGYGWMDALALATRHPALLGTQVQPIERSLGEAAR